MPLFSNYVFVCGGETERYKAVCTGTISRFLPIPEVPTFVDDLQQIKNLIATDAPLAPEQKIEAGQRVRVRSGSFKGFEGTVIRRENEVRLLIYVRYMGQGASVALGRLPARRDIAPSGIGFQPVTCSLGCVPLVTKLELRRIEEI